MAQSLPWSNQIAVKKTKYDNDDDDDGDDDNDELLLQNC